MVLLKKFFTIKDLCIYAGLVQLCLSPPMQSIPNSFFIIYFAKLVPQVLLLLTHKMDVMDVLFFILFFQWSDKKKLVMAELF